MQCLSSTRAINSDHAKLKWFDEIVWLSFGKRAYARNANERGYLFGQIFFLIFVVGSIAFFEYLPFKIFGFVFMAAVNAAAIFMPIKYANKSPYLIWANVILGAIGLLTHWHFGLTIFHLEQYLFEIYLIGGLLAVYRRFWNHTIWKKLNKIDSSYFSMA